MLTAKKGGADKRDVQTPCHNPQKGPGGRSKICSGGQGATECQNGDARKNKEVAGSDFDSCEHTGACLRDIGMEAGIERTYSVKPGTLACGSETAGGGRHDRKEALQFK
jgi:hypothetical protein